MIHGGSGYFLNSDPSKINVSNVIISLSLQALGWFAWLFSVLRINNLAPVLEQKRAYLVALQTHIIFKPIIMRVSVYAAWFGAVFIPN
jgi:hypothetical protein